MLFVIQTPLSFSIFEKCAFCVHLWKEGRKETPTLEALLMRSVPSLTHFRLEQDNAELQDEISTFVRKGPKNAISIRNPMRASDHAGIYSLHSTPTLLISPPMQLTEKGKTGIHAPHIIHSSKPNASDSFPSLPTASRPCHHTLHTSHTQPHSNGSSSAYCSSYYQLPYSAS